MNMTDEKQQPDQPTARALRRELFSDELLDELMSRVDSVGVSLPIAASLLETCHGRRLAQVLNPDIPLPGHFNIFDHFA